MSRKPRFVDMKALASLPGQIKVNYLVWMRCFPGKTVPRLIRLGLIIVVLSIFLIAVSGSVWGIAPFFLILIVAQAYPLWREMTQIHEHFQYGCINAAKVISINPYLIAIYGDLGLHEGDSWPVIKILPQPLEKVQGRRMQAGDKLATVSLYFGYDSSPHWDDFDPIAVPCVTCDERAIRDALWRLNQRKEEDVWDNLERYLALVPQPYRSGLYWMRQR